MAIIVGMADYKVCKAPETLTTLGLGSCVGVCVFDRITKTLGMAHVMLPSSTGFAGQNRAKFADSAIDDLIKLMITNGAGRVSLTAKLAGGAHMFSKSSNDVIKVGERNIIACKKELERLRIPLQAHDTGGTFGRTIELLADGGLKIRTVGGGEKTI